MKRAIGSLRDDSGGPGKTGHGQDDGENEEQPSFRLEPRFGAEAYAPPRQTGLPDPLERIEADRDPVHDDVIKPTASRSFRDERTDTRLKLSVPAPSRKFNLNTKTIAILLAIFGILGSGLATWIAYQAGSNNAGGPVPMVMADYETTKVRPDDAGGIDVPDRDKLVFERLNGAGETSGVERLLPPPEEPLARPEQAAAPNAAPPAAVPSIVPLDAKTQKTAAPAPASAETSVMTPVMSDPGPEVARPAGAPVPDPEPSAGIAESVPVESLLAPAEELASVPPPSSLSFIPSDAWRIQLASLRREGDAEAAWARLRQRHLGVLGALLLFVQEASLDSGTFYRIQAGPLDNRADADAACAALKANDQACIVVAP